MRTLLPTSAFLKGAVRWVENTLIKDGRFHLSVKKALLKNDVQYEAVLVDATETPCEHPKKTAKMVQRQEKTAHEENAGVGRQKGQAHPLYGIFGGQKA
jgi:hypothetical protein